MKKINKLIIFVFILFSLSFYLIACNETKTSFTIEYDSLTYAVGDETFVSISSSSNVEVEWSSSDPSIAKIDSDGIVIFKSAGFVTITATNINDPNDVASVDFTVTEAVVNNIIIYGDMSGSVGETLSFTYKLEPKECECELFWESENSDLVEVSQNGKIKLLAEGIAKIKVTAVDEGTFSTTFMIGIFNYDNVIVDANMNYKDGEEVVYNGKTYFAGFTYVKTIKEAVSAIDENGTIYVLKGKYSENITLNKNGIKVYGVNHKDGSFVIDDVNDSIIEKSIIVSTNSKDIEIKGLTFEEEGNILMYGNNENILIANNKFIENGNGDLTWNALKGFSCINFVADDFESNDITIINNYFKNIKCQGISLYLYKNLKITNNVFEDYALDAIREYYGEGLSSGQLLIRNNKFINGGYNGIYFNVYASYAASYEKIIAIYDNEFKNVGKSIDGQDTYAINFNKFNGGTATISIKYNNFDSCTNNIHFEETERTDLHKYLNAHISYNKFNGDSIKYIVNNQLTKDVVFESNHAAKANGSNLSNLNNLLIGTNDASQTMITLDEFNNAIRVYGKNTLNVNNETTYIIEDEEVTWISANSSVVTIDSKGNAKALKEGTAYLCAYKNGEMITKIKVDVYDNMNVDYASLLVSIALKEEGYVEGSNNYTKYGVWYGEKYGKEFENGAWCAMFVSWCANQANISTSIIPEYALCSAGEQWFMRQDAFGYKGEYTPKTGDIIFFTSAGAGHTGIVVKCENGKLYTIEGNTSNMCAQRTYDLNYKTITGYGIPKYPVYTGEKIDFDVSSSTSGAGQTTQ